MDRRGFDNRSFETGDVVSLDRVKYARLTRGEGALVEMAARRLPQIVGQITAVDSATVEVIWETGRMGIYTTDVQRFPRYTTTEVLISG